MAKPFDLAVGEWWQSTVQTASKISGVYVTPDQGPAQTGITYAWGGGCFDSLRKDLIISGGGHSAYRGNEGYAFSVDPNDADFLKWRVKWKDSTATEGASVEAYSDGTPSSCHGYCCWQYHAGRDKIYRLPGCFVYGTGPNSTVRVYELDASVESPSAAIPSYWTRKTDMPVDTSSGTSVVDPNTGYIFQHRDGGTGSLGPMKYDPGTDTWTELLPGGFGNGVSNYSTGCAADKSNHFMMVGGSGAWSHLMPSASDIVVMANTGATALEGVTGPGFVFSEVDNKFYGWYGLLAGGTDKRDYYKFDFATKVWTRMAGTGSVPPTPEPNGIFGRFMSLDAAGGDYRGLVALVNSTIDEVYFLRVALAPTAALTGTAQPSITEADVVTGGKTVILTLTNDTYAVASLPVDITVVGTPQSGTANNANVTLTFDVAPVQGDVVFVAGGHDSNGGSSVTPVTSGYTQVINDTASQPYFGVWYKVMGASPDTTVVMPASGAANDAGAYCAIVLRNVHSSVLGATTTTAGPTASTNPDPASITTTAANSMVLVFGLSTSNDAAPGTMTNYTVAGSAGLNLSGVDASVSMGRRVIAAAGAENPPAWSAWTTGTWKTATLEVKRLITTPFDDARAAIASGLDSAQSEAAGWDAKVKPNIPVGNVVRTSNTVVTVTLQAQADYNTTATETITATIPAAAVAGGAAIVATPTFQVTSTSGVNKPGRVIGQAINTSRYF